MAPIAVHHVQKSMRLGRRDAVKYQLLTHCFIEDIRLSDNEIDCLSLLGVSELQNLSAFCRIVVDEGIFKTEQTVRNFINRASSMNLVHKDSSAKLSRIFIKLDDSLQVVSADPLVLDYRVVYASQE